MEKTASDILLLKYKEELLTNIDCINIYCDAILEKFPLRAEKHDYELKRNARIVLREYVKRITEVPKIVDINATYIGCLHYTGTIGAITLSKPKLLQLFDVNIKAFNSSCNSIAKKLDSDIFDIIGHAYLSDRVYHVVDFYDSDNKKLHKEVLDTIKKLAQSQLVCKNLQAENGMGTQLYRIQVSHSNIGWMGDSNQRLDVLLELLSKSWGGYAFEYHTNISCQCIFGGLND
jgi:hypothetical protein